MLWNDYLLHPHNLLLFWLFYSLICLPIAFVLMMILPFRLRRHRPLLLFCFFYALCVAIFIFGIVISFVLVMFLHYQKPLKKQKELWSTVDYPDYQKPPLSEFTEYGEGSGFKIVTSSNMAKTLRQNMLVAINQFENKNTNKINSLALSDDMDEIRLYAQSLIEKKERELSYLVKNFTLKIAKTNDPKIIAYYKKQIAEILWEQVYKYLVVNENLVVTLNKIKLYAKEALDVFPDDMVLPLLLTKVALQESNLEEAKEWLNIATNNQAPDYKVLSILAEIEYMEKHYSKIKGILASCRSKGIIGLQSVISFWVTHD